MKQASKWSMNTLLALNTISVIVSILLATGIEQLLTHYTTIDSAVARLIFAATFPTLLLIFQSLLHRYSQTKTSNVLIAETVKTSFTAETIAALNTFQKQTTKFLAEQYDVQSFDFYVFDWQTNYFVCNVLNKDNILPAKHALVELAQTTNLSFSTEHLLPQEISLSAIGQTEVNIFMKRHQYALAIPLLTVQGVYGYLFLTLTQLKDTKLMALPDVNVLKNFSLSYGSLLQKIIVYDAIVMHPHK